MKHFLLLISFLFFTSINVATADQTPLGPDWPASISVTNPIQVYPNPATNYIGITEPEGVKKIYVFNLVGKRMKLFQDIAKDKHYFIGDLPRGMYLVQMVDTRNQVIVTRRVSKR